MNRLQANFLIASVPAALAGAWNLGEQVAQSGAATSWPLTLLERIGIGFGRANAATSIAIGVAYFVPLLVTALIASRTWAEVFSRFRRRPLDPGWALTAWLYTLLLPATMPIHYAALGLSFGVVFGSHVFGGTGRYLVNPALLGIVFTAIAYPELVGPTAWLPSAAVPTSWAEVAEAGGSASGDLVTTWQALFLGREIGALGTSSALACLLGAAFLVARRAASARIIAAALASLSVAAALGSELPWHWHLALGNFAFSVAFLVTDPTTEPKTKGGEWAYGALFGALTVVLRTLDPEHPEGTWFALLLASLCVPLLDHIARAIAARRGRAAPAADG